MSYYNLNPCRLNTVIDFSFYIVLVLLLVYSINYKTFTKNLYSTIIVLAVLFVVYSLFRAQLHTSIGVSTDVDIWGNPRPNYCK